MEAHLRKSLGCFEKSAGRNMGVKVSFDKVSERSKNYGRESFHCLKKYIYYHDLNVARDVNIKGASGENLEESGKMLDTESLVIQWQKIWLNYILPLGEK